MEKFYISEEQKEKIFLMSREKYEQKKGTPERITHHPRKWQKAMNIAAAFIITASVTGSALMIQKISEVGAKPEVYQPMEEVETAMEEVETVIEEVETAAEETTPEMTEEIPSQEEIYLKMLNSMDYVHQISGIYLGGVTDSESNLQNEISIDLDTGEIYEKLTKIHVTNRDEFLQGAEPQVELAEKENTEDMTEWAIYDNGEKNYRIIGNTLMEGDTNLFTCREEPISSEDIPAIDDWYAQYTQELNDDGSQKDYIHTDFFRNSCLETMEYISSQQLAANCLTNFSTWECSGTEEFLGRKCLIIECRPSVSKNDSMQLYVDEATGFVLKCMIYDETNALLEYSCYEEIHFDEEAEMIRPDLSQYELEDNYHPRNSELHVNAKGETYGAAFCRIEQKNRDILPDLIAVGTADNGDGYIRTDDLLTTFVDAEEAFDMQKEKNNVSETAVPKEINVYNQESEFLFTITLYTEPENIQPE